MRGARLAGTGRTDKKKNNSLKRARAGNLAAILGEGLMVADHSRKVLLPERRTAGAGVYGFFHRNKVGAGTLGLGSSEFSERASDRRVRLAAVRDRLGLRTAARLEVERVALGLKVLEERKPQNGRKRARGAQLKVTLQVVGTGLTYFLLETHVGDRGVDEVGFTKEKRLKAFGLREVKRKAPVTVLRHGQRGP